MLIFQFIFVALCVVLLASISAIYAEKLEEHIEFSLPVVGIILLAAATSLPEVSTALATIQTGNIDLLVANILGSNFFNLLILGIMDILFIRKRIFTQMSQRYNGVFFYVLCMNLVLILGFSVKKGNSILLLFPSIALVILYGIALYRIPKVTEEIKTDEVSNQDDRKKIIFRFLLAALLLIFSAIGLVSIVDKITYTYSISTMVAGAVLIGIITSLPELVSSITLTRRGNYTMILEAILGSNMFNFLILVFADILLFQNSVYDVTKRTYYISFITLSIVALSVIFLAINNRFIQRTMRYIPGCVGIVLGLLYILSFWI